MESVDNNSYERIVRHGLNLTGATKIVDDQESSKGSSSAMNNG